jgi:propanol-preferring alcohol dehydrogenase
VALAQQRTVYAFTRPGDRDAQAFAKTLGVHWAGASNETAPAPLDAALIFAPVGPLVPAALAATARGGSVICAGIHMSDIPAFPYRLLWGERSVGQSRTSRATTVRPFWPLPQDPLSVHVEPYPLFRANDALAKLRAGAVAGAAVLTPGG